MNILRRHIRSIALLSTLLTLTGVYGYFCAREWVAKWTFAHQTEFGLDEVIRIAIPTADLSPKTTFLTNQNEFDWQGDMVDVLHREIRSDTLIIYGFRDVAETTLKQKAAWLYQEQNQPGNVPGFQKKQLHWETTIPTDCQPFTSCLWPGNVPGPRVLFAYTAIRRRHPYLEVPSPPPDPFRPNFPV